MLDIDSQVAMVGDNVEGRTEPELLSPQKPCLMGE